MRVALVLHGFSAGGVERSMVALGREFVDRGHEVDFVVGEARGELRSTVPSWRVVELSKVKVPRARVAALRADPFAWKLLLGAKEEMSMAKPLARQLPAMADYLRRTRPDAVLAAQPHYNLLAVWGRQLSGLEAHVVVTEHTVVSHDNGPWREPRLRDLLRRGYLRADAVVAVSRGAAGDLAGHADLPRDRVLAIYNPVVGPDLYAKMREPVIHPWFKPGEPPVILATGRLSREKDYVTLIRAVAQARASRPVRLMILGGDSPLDQGYGAELELAAAQAGMSADLSMPGYVSNPFAYMARAAVFVSSSLYEGLGNALIEAMACNMRVISTDCPGGPCEVLSGGLYGTLVSVGDHFSMARAIEDALDAPTNPLTEIRARDFGVKNAADQYLGLLLPETCDVQ